MAAAPGGRVPPTRELSHYDLWEHVVGALAAGADDSRSDRRRAPAAGVALGRARVLRRLRRRNRSRRRSRARRPTRSGGAPDAAGLVDHDRIGDAWEQAKGAVSLTEMLLDELRTPTAPA